MRISFDLDGVLFDFSTPAIQMIRETYPNLNLPADYQHKVWSFADILTPGQWDVVFNKLMAINNFWTYLPAFEENVAPLREYIEAHGSYDVFFVTARPECAGGSAKSMTSLSLMDNGLPFHNLVMAPSHAAKPAILQQYGIQAHLDDYAPTIRACQGLPGLSAYVLDRLYNQDAKDLPRVYSTAEYLLEVE